MPVLDQFSVDDLVACGRVVREIAVGVPDMTAAADLIAGYLMDTLTTADGGPACGVLHLHRTQAFRTLPSRLQALGREAAPDVEDNTVCLVHLGSRESVPTLPKTASDWVRPFTPNEITAQPIILRLLAALGVDLETIKDPARVLAQRMQHHSLNVYLEHDLASGELIPDGDARSAIASSGLRSLVALGGILPSGDLLVVSLFSIVHVDEHVADLLRSLGTSIKAALIPYTYKPYPELGPST